MGIDKLENEDIFQQANEHIFRSPEVRDENSLSTFKYSKIVEVLKKHKETNKAKVCRWIINKITIITFWCLRNYNKKSDPRR